MAQYAAAHDVHLSDGLPTPAECEVIAPENLRRRPGTALTSATALIEAHRSCVSVFSPCMRFAVCSLSNIGLSSELARTTELLCAVSHRPAKGDSATIHPSAE